MKKTLIFIGLFIVSALLLPTFMSMCENKIEQETEDFELETPKIEENTNEENTDENIKKAAAKIIKMVKDKDKEAISKIISYPLYREYPIPPVRDKKDFIERFDEIFDSEQINNVENASAEFWDVRHGICLTGSDYLILCFNADSVGNPYIYEIESSETEEKKIKQLIESERNNLHTSLKSFLNPVILIENSTHLIRIDRINKKVAVIEDEECETGYRLALWKKGGSISDKPDLILTNGIKSFGFSIYSSYKFTNGNKEYVFRVGMSGNPHYIDDSDTETVYWSERSKLK